MRELHRPEDLDAIAAWLAGAPRYYLQNFVDSGNLIGRGSVSYTHLDVYKRQALHTADAVVDVLLFTIVRQMIVNHTDAVETLLGVAAVAGIFAIKKFLQTREDAE